MATDIFERLGQPTSPKDGVIGRSLWIAEN